MEKQKIRTGIILAFAIISVATSGCVSVMPEQKSVPETDPIEMEIRELARLTLMEHQKLARKNGVKGASDQYVKGSDPRLERRISFGEDRWHGPAEPFLKYLSVAAGLEFNALAKPDGGVPGNHLIVNIDVNSRRVIDIIRDTALALEGRAHLKLDIHGDKTILTLVKGGQ